MTITLADIARLEAKIKFGGDDECWIWTAAIAHGYGRIKWGDRVAMAHRVVYELLVGPIPEGLDIDHLCRVRACVNPSHLEPVTRAVNLARGDTMFVRNAAKAECLRGHPYDEENTYKTSKGRACRACRQERDERNKEERRERDRQRYARNGDAIRARRREIRASRAS